VNERASIPLPQAGAAVEAPAGSREATSTGPLTDAQPELNDYFASLAETFSLPRSAGQIYGLLFGQPAPVPFDEIVALLGISKGSASGSLKLLRRLKAVHARHELGDRRTFFEAETSVRHLVQAFLEDGVNAHLEESETRLDAIHELVERESAAAPDAPTELLQRRIASLRTWHGKARRLLPWIARLTLPRKRDRDRDDA